MRKDKIALQLHSVRDELQQDFYETLKKVKKMGYSGVEFAGLFGRDPMDVKAWCADLGLDPISAHVPLVQLMEDLETTIDCYADIGCKYVVIPYLAESDRYGSEAFNAMMDRIPAIGEELAKRGMVLQYHNHDFEFASIGGEYVLDYMYRTVGPDKLQTQLDTCWVNVGGEDPVKYLKKYAGRIPTVHLKDFAGRRSDNMYVLIGLDDNRKEAASGEFEFRPLGKGLQNIPAIVEAATEGGAEWFIVEQDRPSMGLSAMECAKVSMDYLMNEVL